MKWIFVHANLLTELNTGFSIRLISGTWSNPIEVRPDKITVSIYDQPRLLRLGLVYANSDRKGLVDWYSNQINTA